MIVVIIIIIIILILITVLQIQTSYLSNGNTAVLRFALLQKCHRRFIDPIIFFYLCMHFFILNQLFTAAGYLISYLLLGLEDI
jgi:hypothetical protein